MLQKIKFLSLLLLCGLAVSCASGLRSTPDERPIMTEIVLRNKSTHALEDVSLRVQKFNQIFSCSYILENSECANRFPPRPYQENAITIDWTIRGQSYSSGPLVVSAAHAPKSEAPLRAVIEFRNDRNFSAHFETMH